MELEPSCHGSTLCKYFFFLLAIMTVNKGVFRGPWPGIMQIKRARAHLNACLSSCLLLQSGACFKAQHVKSQNWISRKPSSSFLTRLIMDQIWLKLSKVGGGQILKCTVPPTTNFSRRVLKLSIVSSSPAEAYRDYTDFFPNTALFKVEDSYLIRYVPEKSDEGLVSATLGLTFQIDESHYAPRTRLDSDGSSLVRSQEKELWVLCEATMPPIEGQTFPFTREVFLGSSSRTFDHFQSGASGTSCKKRDFLQDFFSPIKIALFRFWSPFDVHDCDVCGDDDYF